VLTGRLFDAPSVADGTGQTRPRPTRGRDLFPVVRPGRPRGDDSRSAAGPPVTPFSAPTALAVHDTRSGLTARCSNVRLARKRLFPEPAYGRIRRRPVLGGLINQYEPGSETAGYRFGT
jgi:hypothetical protein